MCLLPHESLPAVPCHPQQGPIGLAPIGFLADAMQRIGGSAISPRLHAFTGLPRLSTVARIRLTKDTFKSNGQSLKTDTTSARRWACSRSEADAAEDSSTSAAFCWVIWSRLATA